MINLEKIGWQNGTLVSKAKVQVNGQIYEVEPEEYEGTTPLSAENLIQMEENTENAINEVDEKIPDIYSTEETKIKKIWINGKPNYRKCFAIGSLPNNTTDFIKHNIIDFERMTDIKASWYDIQDNRWYELNRPGDNNVRIVITTNNQDLIIQAAGVDWSSRTRDCVVTLEYTKTTD